MGTPTEESNISLEDTKKMLDSIQAAIEKVLSKNGQVNVELKELKASLKAKDREVRNLQESLSKTRETNQVFKTELAAAKIKIKQQEEETNNLWDSLDSLEQYTRKTVWKSLALRLSWLEMNINRIVPWTLLFHELRTCILPYMIWYDMIWCVVIGKIPRVLVFERKCEDASL